MCEPTTILAVTAVAGLALSGAQAVNQKRQGEANAQASEQQARIDQMASADAMQQGDRETERMLWRTRGILGEQRAAIAAAGVDPTLGTPSEILGETAFFGEMERQDTRLNAARAAWGYDVSAGQNLTRASNERTQGRNQSTATILGGLTGAANTYYGNRAPRQTAGFR